MLYYYVGLYIIKMRVNVLTFSFFLINDDTQVLLHIDGYK